MKLKSAGPEIYQSQTPGLEQKTNITLKAGRLLPHTVALKTPLPIGTEKYKT